jgi:hypothetical protein
MVDPSLNFSMEKGILPIYREMSKGAGVSWMNHPCQKVIFFMSGWSVLFFKRRRFLKKLDNTFGFLNWRMSIIHGVCVGKGKVVNSKSELHLFIHLKQSESYTKSKPSLNSYVFLAEVWP